MNQYETVFILTPVLSFFVSEDRIYPGRDLPLQSCLNNNFMIEQFNFDIRLIFAILNGKVSAAINRKLYRNSRFI